MKVVLAYSGGLDTSIILHWLSYEKNYDVIAYYADIGQNDNINFIKKKALSHGASEVIIEDQKESLVSIAKSSIQSDAFYENGYLLGTALSRPIIAKSQAELAKQYNAALAHGATGKGNDQVRFELSYKYFYKDAKIIAPWKLKEFLKQFSDRSSLLAYAEKNDIEIPANNKKYSIDDNLLHTSYEGSLLEDPNSSSLTIVDPKNLNPLLLSLYFKDGFFEYLSIDNKKYISVDAFNKLKQIGFSYGIANDIVENRFIGFKSRGVYFQAPLEIPFKAHLYLQSMALQKDLYHFKLNLGAIIGTQIYNGKLFSQFTTNLFKFSKYSDKGVSGYVDVLVYPYGFKIHSASLLDSNKQAIIKSGGFSMKDFDPELSKGFIELTALQEGL